MNKFRKVASRWLFALVVCGSIAAAYSVGVAQQMGRLARFSAGTPAKANEVNDNFVYVERLALNAAPPGSISAFAGPADRVPEGWLLADGRQVSRSTYANLFAAIGCAWGPCDQAIFRLPDLRGVFLRGADHVAGGGRDASARQPLGNLSQEDSGSLQGQSTADPGVVIGGGGAHQHGMGVNRADSNTMVVGGAAGRLAHFAHDQYGNGSPHVTHGVGDHTHGLTGWGAETRPINVSVNYIIKL